LDEAGGGTMKISNQKLAIGVPCSFPHIPSSFFYSFVHMEKPEFIFIHADNGPVDVLRNDIVRTAIEQEATHLLMLDVDQVYHPKTITTLLSRRLPIVGAAVCRRYPPFDPIILRLTDNGYESTDEWNDNGLVECDATGSGCLMFEMSIFKRLPDPWFRFQKNPDNGMTIGEDIGICQDLKALGYKIFVDTSVPAGHLTTMIINRNTHLLYRSMKEKQNKQALERALKNDN
jgi:hypothetical protein